MKPGKLPTELLKKLVFDNIKSKNPHVLIGPEVGEDCAAIKFGEYVCVLSTDPITGAEKGAGTLAIHISCNDIASCGVEPIGILITLMVPIDGTEADIDRVMKEAGEAAKELGVEIIGGHTEITSAVNKMIISTTAIGKAPIGGIVTTKGAKIGDDIIMTKWAGLEGTSIIASDFANELNDVLSKNEIESAQSLIDYISVVPEGVIAGKYGVNSMHDVTEGGILGASWEIAEISETGIELHLNKIPILETTKKICDYYGIDPYRLISSGSMIMTCKDGEKLVCLLKSKGIAATVIGRIIDKDRIIIDERGNVSKLEPPKADELFKVV
ncbi:MAG: AIR synthase [Clostridiales bacterium]|nr:AIR synthase [Clostridiales bacterium]